MSDVLALLGKKMIFFDGGTGTLLQEKGLPPGELPENWNMTHGDIIKGLHKDYLMAGCDIISTNTFGANGLKFSGVNSYSMKEVVSAAVAHAKDAINEVCTNRKAFVALDISSTGKLLKPLGDLEFEEAYCLFKEAMCIGEEAGADLIIIETMSDTYEMKAAVLAAKENTKLPVFATMIFDEKGKLLTGADVPSVVAMLEGLRVDALGINCGLGPVQMKGILAQILEYSSIPVIVNPNAGLPRSVNGKTIFDVNAEEFADVMLEIAQMGAWAVGGCCGTTPAHIAEMVKIVSSVKPKPILKKDKTIVSSYSRAVEIGKNPIIIGERINPTGKSKFKQALREKDIDYILREGISQQQNGAHILDVNVGLPDIDETDMMELVIKELQSVIDLPLQIDTSDFAAMESALRVYNGKALINSVNGKKEVMEQVFPLVKKYGGVVVGLALDESGIPETAEGRLMIAEKIYTTAASYGIDKKDIIIDTLAMTISSDSKSASQTLKALRLVREKLDGKTILGVSNISFGLPQRENVNAVFYTLALQNGLSAAIINPGSEAMMKSYYSFRALMGIDEQCIDYIASYSGQPNSKPDIEKTEISLSQSIQKGLKERAHAAAKELIKTIPPLTIINMEMIPALDNVGKGFEKGTIFLPQLLMSAEAAKSAFDVIKAEMELSGEIQEKKGKIVLATVKGDIHDIGKNIVKVLLENYSYDVIDLGKDVDPKYIVDEVLEKKVSLVGLSALMTTTVTSMEATIKLLRKSAPNCKIMVGGAVMTQEYADRIGADHYSKDAMSSVYYAADVFSCSCGCE